MIAMYKTDDRIIREIEAYEPGAWINLTAPTLEQARKLERAYRKNAEVVYQSVMVALLEEAEG